MDDGIFISVNKEHSENAQSCIEHNEQGNTTWFNDVHL